MVALRLDGEWSRSGFEAEPVALGLAAIEAADWDRLVAPGQGPLRHDYLAAWQRAELAGLELRPLAARAGADGRLLAASPGYFYDLDLALTHSPYLAGALGTVRRLAPRLAVTRVYEIGTSIPLLTPLLRSGEVSTAQATEALVRAGLREADRGGAQMTIVQSFERTAGGAADVLRREGLSPVPLPPIAIVELPFESFDDYAAAMRAQYRRRLRRAFAASSGLHVEHRRDFGSETGELARLWRLVYARAREVKRELLPEGWFRAVAGLEQTSLLALRRADGSIASYALLLDDRPWLHFLYTGFEESAGREECAYFRLIYEIVRHAIEHDFATVNLGMTTLEPKLDAGGVPVPLYGWLHHRRASVQRLFARLGSGRFAPRRVEPRNVFRS